MAEKPKCFIIMPVTTRGPIAGKYGDDKGHFKHVLECLFVPAVERAGFQPVPPTTTGSAVMHAEIVKNLAESEIVLCDMTSLNANVFFELGIRTALDKPACHVRDKHFDQVAFDVSNVQYHEYDGKLQPWNLESEVTTLAAHITTVRDNSNGTNSMWNVFGLEAKAAEPASESSPTAAKLDLILRDIATIKGHLSPDPAIPDKQRELAFLVEADVPTERLLNALEQLNQIPEVSHLEKVDEAFGAPHYAVFFQKQLGPSARTKLRHRIMDVLSEQEIDPADVIFV